MPANFKRTDRVSEMIQRKLAQIIQQEIHDPRVPGFITISAVNVTRDLSHAKVYFTVFNGDPSVTETVLSESAAYLRSILARTVTLRTVPQLHFIHDKSVEYGSRLSRLIDKVNDSDIDGDDEQKSE
jgi:ribosome-binding factor A